MPFGMPSKPNIIYSFFLSRIYSYLKGGIRQREEQEKASIDWFIPQVAQTERAGTFWGKELEGSSVSYLGAGAQALRTSSDAFPVRLAGSCIESGAAGSWISTQGFSSAEDKIQLYCDTMLTIMYSLFLKTFLLLREVYKSILL